MMHEELRGSSLHLFLQNIDGKFSSIQVKRELAGVGTIARKLKTCRVPKHVIRLHLIHEFPPMSSKVF